HNGRTSQLSAMVLETRRIAPDSNAPYSFEHRRRCELMLNPGAPTTAWRFRSSERWCSGGAAVETAKEQRVKKSAITDYTWAKIWRMVRALRIWLPTLLLRCTSGC